jgi:hypothetical protein
MVDTVMKCNEPIREYYNNKPHRSLKYRTPARAYLNWLSDMSLAPAAERSES